jgi:GT2 family glycosyltransferase
MLARKPETHPVAIGVPVRNEIERLPRLLAALAQQQEAPSFVLCLYFDNCTDGSIKLVQRRAAALPFSIASDYCDAGGSPSAGAARRRAMALAFRHAPDGILLTTDADSEPALDWVATNLEALVHADVVAGRITRAAHRAPDPLDRMGAYLDRLHQLRRILDPVPWEATETHHWTSGASIAVRAEVYRKLGGFDPVRSGEDGKFVDAAARAGYRVRCDARVLVKTSSRRVGRAPDGFATALATSDRTSVLPETTHPVDMLWRFRQQANARAAYHAGAFDTLAAALGLSENEVIQVAAKSVNDQAFASRIVGAPRGGMRSIGLAHAEALLSSLERVGLLGGNCRDAF